ncbi:MAG: PLP-dependent aminotransferase family protein, partial [Candidatus Obscuribacterales bacterium]|nr:PLP-dependent aminotransferase family protein [Candidatus Obscuribacterales bacterium]
AISFYLFRSRGLEVPYERICIFSGAQSALDLLSRMLIDKGDDAYVENPGYPEARRLFLAYGACLNALPVDGEGLVTNALPEQAEDARLIYLTPAHHDPTGVVLSDARRSALLDWAKRHDVWIIEDDFDSDIRYGEKPSSCLVGIDKDQSVIYLSSFWKVLFPVLCLGFLVVPQRLVPVLSRAKGLTDRYLHNVEHEALADFIAEGHLEKHVRRLRTIYARRRRSVIELVNKGLAGKALISPVSAGTHLLLHFKTEMSQAAILDCAQKSGFPMVSTSSYYFENPVENEVLVPFAHLDEIEMAKRFEKFLSLCVW